jgi:hypothetical protein
MGLIYRQDYSAWHTTLGSKEGGRKNPVQAAGFYGALLGVSDKWIKFLFWIYLLFLIGVAGTAVNPADPDLWHRLAVGEYLWQTHHFPVGDTFSYLPDFQNVADHEWGSALIFFAVYKWAGLNAFVGLKLITLVITLVLLVRAGLYDRRVTAWLAAFYVLVLLALLPSFQSTLRCMAFTHIFFALWLYWFQRERKGSPVGMWAYVVTMIVWANLHGGFAIGLLWLLVITAVEAFSGRPWKTWAIRLGLCLLATLVNPFGWQLWIATIRALVVTRRGFPEWGPIPWGAAQYPGYKLLLIGLLIAVAVQAYRKGWRWIDYQGYRGLIFMGVFLALSLDSARHTSLFAEVAAVFVPGLFPRAEWMPPHSIHPLRRLGSIAISSTLLLVPLYASLIVMPGDGFRLRYDPASCPVGGVAYLQRGQVRGKLLVPFNYGSYALWELRGRMRVSMDGRYDLVYRPATYRRVDDFFLGRGNGHTLLTTPRPDAILVPILDPVYSKLQEQAAWKEAWHDSTDAVFLPK